ncbi:MAG: beta galactosidase jelly roll domain-containing protein [Chitinispirillaceae bacterium]|nr:beta galactosidase jelly roll domain-containing protein [Chitinispirillaceae bacterium]
MSSQRAGSIVCLFLGTFFLAAQADFYPERVYKERSKIKLNGGWTFYSEMRGNAPAPGNPYEAGYADSSWTKVSIPSSATYDAPTKTEEDKTITGGMCWYRKKFTVPATVKHAGKLFLQFDGAMQTATVWLNGYVLGVHDNSGYTEFKFDITDNTVTGDNVLVVRLDNTYNAAIPPGNTGDVYGPDFYLFSGLYRNVWLVCTDKCYIPINGQKISVERKNPAMTTASKAYIKIKTPVKNEYTTAKNVVIQYCIAYGDIDRGLLADSSVGTVAAGQTTVFDTILSFDNPALWSPSNPYLYRLFTRVLADGAVVDDNVDRFGVRWFTWNPNESFKVNDQTVYVRGTCMHQMFPWIQNAATPSRFYKDIKLAKDMGANLIRCAHYPRDPSWYNACDEMGMLLLVEVPTWGVGKTTYPDSFWTRSAGCMDEMIEVGYNHPSIMAWGLFNEPSAEFTGAITALNNQAHRCDSTRLTYMASNRRDLNIMNIPDIAGLNYLTSADITVTPLPQRLVNTEFHPGWTTNWTFRGDTKDDIATIAHSYWSDWLVVVADAKESGGMVWCHADYNSPVTSNAMGVVDAYRIPKSIYYLFRKNWTNVSYDYDIPVTGTARALEIVADTNKLMADGTDCAFIYVTVRDAAGKCIHTGYGSTSTTTVNFTVTGTATPFGSTAVKVNGGKCALLIRSTTTPGPITVSASSYGLTGASTTITSVADTYNPHDYQFITPVIPGGISPVVKNISFVQTGTVLRILAPTKELKARDISILNIKGQNIAFPVVAKDRELLVDTRQLTSGSYVLCIKNALNGKACLRKYFIAQ